jgi:4'-phosphopantetheinyl transferase
MTWRVPAIVEPALSRELPATDGVRIWVASLDHSPEVAQRISERLLSDDERARAEALRGEAKRTRFIVARGVLRVILGDATGTAPERVAFTYGSDGKPAIANRPAGPAIQFNMSHCRDLALYAVSDGRRTGIDVEWTQGTYPFEGIARRFFSAGEQAALDEATPGERRLAFFRIWVRKEAYLKGRGEGISEWIHDTDLSRLSLVEPLAVGTAAMRDQDGWIIRDLGGLPPGFLASVAVERSGG